MTDAAERMRRHRARRRAGLAVLPVEVDLDLLAEFLVLAAYLKPDHYFEREVIARAAGEYLQEMADPGMRDASRRALSDIARMRP